MSEPVITLAEVRRTVCRELKMPFSRRYKAGFLTSDAGGDTISLVDTDLTQGDNFWRNSWIYRTASQECSLITQFIAKDNTLKVEVPITEMAEEPYEIHSKWNAYEIHDAINEAIRNVRRVFPDNVTDETLIIQEDVRAYTLSGLTKVPWIIHQILLEQPQSVKRGQAVSATSTTLVVENNGILADVTSSWKVSIYDGTGKGQIRSVASVASATITVTAWTTTPDSTSKYALWNASEETFDWYRFDAVRISSKEFPTTLYFSIRPQDFMGLRIRIEYTAYAAELSAEADTTVVPLEYLKYATLSILHSQKISDTKADRDLHFGEWKRFNDMANEYVVRNTPHRPDSMIFTNPEHQYQARSDDPLNWQSG